MSRCKYGRRGGAALRTLVYQSLELFSHHERQASGTEQSVQPPHVWIQVHLLPHSLVLSCVAEGRRHG